MTSAGTTPGSRTRFALVAAVWALVLAAGGCTSDGSHPAGTSPPAAASDRAPDPSANGRPPGSTPGAAAGRSQAPGPGQFVNPVFADNFPDPAVLLVGTTFHAYATQGDGRNIQTLVSADLVHWTRGADALPELGGWATAGDTWAPEVIALDRGSVTSYAMFYVARDTANGKQCIGRAVATDPEGPFTDRSDTPFLCQPDLGGSIDPNPVRDSDGHLYLYWKNDGNCCGKQVWLWGVGLTPDTTRPDGQPVRLLTNTKPWQGNLIEAPEMLEHDGSHVLFYSANDYASAAYAVGYASCSGPLGPCTDESDRPLLASTGDAAGPGHCFPFTLRGGESWMMFHAWQPDAIGTSYPGRELWLEPLRWNGPSPIVAAPVLQPQTRPGTASG